jgi:hypothetical protein
MTKSDQLDIIGKYFYGDGADCIDCKHYRPLREPRGEFWGRRVWETMAECGALEREKPHLCPLLGELLAKEYD